MGEGFDLRSGVRFLNIICGFTLFGLAIWHFITIEIDPFVIITNIYWMYWYYNYKNFWIFNISNRI